MRHGATYLEFFPWNIGFKIVTAYDLLLPHQLIKLIDEINCSNWSEIFFFFSAKSQASSTSPQKRTRWIPRIQSCTPGLSYVTVESQGGGVRPGEAPWPFCSSVTCLQFPACNLGVWESTERHDCTMNTSNVVSQQGTCLSGTKDMGC